MQLHLFEKFILIALDHKKGKFIIDSFSLNYGLAGAILLELSELNKIAIQNKRIVIVDKKLTNHNVIDESIQILSKSKKNRKPRQWIYKLGNKSSAFKKSILKDLHMKKILRIDVKTYVWGLIKMRRYPVINSREIDAIKDRIREVVMETTKPEVEDILLLSLMSSCKLTRILFATKKEHRKAKNRIKELTKDIEIGEAISQALKEIQTAVMVATTSTFVSSSSS